jgi:hypothetical protein
MITLAEMRARVLEALGDPAGARHTPAQVEEGLRLALEEYSRAAPQVVTAVIIADQAGREQPLDAIGSLLYPISAAYPWSADAEARNGRGCELCGCTFYRRDGRNYLYLVNGPIPAPGDAIRVSAGVLHTLEGLGGAPVTTLPEGDAGLLAEGAAAHVGYMRAGTIVQSYGKRNPQDETAAVARERLQAFRQRLEHLPTPLPPAAPWSAGWKLDAWDAGN